MPSFDDTVGITGYAYLTNSEYSKQIDVIVQASLITPNNTTKGVWAVQNVVKNKDGIITSFNRVNAALFDAADGLSGTVKDRNGVLGIGGGVKTAEYWAYTKDTKVLHLSPD